MSTSLPLTNGQLAELLARAADREEAHRARALRRASRWALVWPEEAAVLAERGALTELRAVGPWVAGIVEGWLEEPPPVPDPPETRRGFVTLVEAQRVLERETAWDGAFRTDLQIHTTWSDGVVPR